MNASRYLIAVVDDEEPVRTALKRLLRSADLDVTTFPSGAEFLESLQTQRPDCVILDLHMPHISGFEVQDRLSELPEPLPVIIITGNDSTTTEERALARMPAAYLCKPVNDQTLLDAIEKALRRDTEH